MLSRHGVLAPRVAAPPAFQYTAAPAPLPMAFAAESGALSGVRGRREAQAAPALPSLPSLSSARVPDGFVIPAGTVRTPGRGAKPLKSVRSEDPQLGCLRRIRCAASACTRARRPGRRRSVSFLTTA